MNLVRGHEVVRDGALKGRPGLGEFARPVVGGGPARRQQLQKIGVAVQQPLEVEEVRIGQTDDLLDADLEVVGGNDERPGLQGLQGRPVEVVIAGIDFHVQGLGGGDIVLFYDDDAFPGAALVDDLVHVGDGGIDGRQERPGQKRADRLSRGRRGGDDEFLVLVEDGMEFQGFQGVAGAFHPVLGEKFRNGVRRAAVVAEEQIEDAGEGQVAADLDLLLGRGAGVGGIVIGPQKRLIGGQRRGDGLLEQLGLARGDQIVQGQGGALCRQRGKYKRGGGKDGQKDAGDEKNTPFKRSPLHDCPPLTKKVRSLL